MTMALFPNKFNSKSIVGSRTTDWLRIRLRQSFGAFLFLVGFSTLLILISYEPKDPSFRSATNMEPQNLLGQFGSHIADPLHLALGMSSYLFVALFFSWGYRLFILEKKMRLLNRVIVTPFAIFSLSALLAVHPSFGGWHYTYGLGGVFGDAVISWILDLNLFDINTRLKVVTIGLLFVTLGINGYALGVNKKETKSILKSFYYNIFLAFKMTISPLFKVLKSSKKKQNLEVNLDRTLAQENDHTENLLSENENRIKNKIETVLLTRKPTFNNPIETSHGEIDPVKGDFQKVLNDENEFFLPSLGGVTKDGGIVISQNNKGMSSDLRNFDGRVFKKRPRRPLKSTKAIEEEQPTLEFETAEKGYQTPNLSLLENPSNIVRHLLSNDALNENARLLENVLDDYGVKGEIVSVRPGPVVTLYELEPAAGLKASRVIGLSDDIARSMSALSARVSTIPGRSVIGIELPNSDREKVLLREILSSKAYGDSKFQLPLALGKDIGGEPVVANLAKMPHLLIAGTTGSGKSVGINTMILSLLYRLTPEECRLIMIDPKMLELSVYDGIPHLLSPVVTDPKKAIVALKWAVVEMEERYRKMSKMGVRNIDGFNSKVSDAILKGESFNRTVQTGFDNATGDPKFETEHFTPEKMPYIVVVVDEMADLMMVSGKEIEACIQRLAQMARAAGIHLIMATQRPSVDVITGTIKANFPTRISFQVTSKIDSRTILGEMGAEQLLGMGDMLYMANGGRITRIHGPFVSDEEVEEIVNFLKLQGEPEYVSGVLDGPDNESESRIDQAMGLVSAETDNENALFDHAVAIVAQDRKCSTSYIQRKLSIGYNRAAKIVEAMEEQGIVSPANHVGKREILLPEH